ncbi:MAG: hypothetical protein ACI3T9_01170 [Romboutsia timonensis]
MNRIVLDYFDKEGSTRLEVHNDIKGYSYEKVMEITGPEAKLMFELLKNVDYSKTENCMDYGIRVNGEEQHTCCICGKEFIGYGNNPDPVKKEGRCCDDCNSTKVIPARLEEWVK